MRKFTLFIASLFLALGAKADFTQTFLRGGTFWGSAVDNYPSGVTSVIDEHYGSGQVHCASVDVQVQNTSDITVTFGYTDGYHKLNILGVVLEDNKGNVCYYDYHKGTAGGSLVDNEYTLSNVSSGIYTLRYYVYDLTSGDNDKVVYAGGNITIKNADILTPVSRTDWSVAASSQETSGDPGQATNAIDGNNGTFWHTVYAKTYPHWIEFDMKKTYNVYSFDYVSRFDNTNSNGNILNYKLYVSNSAMNGNYENATLAASGTFVYGQGVNHLIKLDSPVAGRYVALVAESGTKGDWGGNLATTAANCAEFNVYGIEKKAAANEAAKAALAEKIAQAEALLATITIGDGVGEYSGTYSALEIESVLGSMKNYYKSIDESTSIEEIEGFVDMIEEAIASYSLNMPVAGKYYRLKNNASGWYATSDLRTGESQHATKLYMKEDGTQANTIWYLDSNNAFLSYTKGQYLGDMSSDWSFEAVGSTGNAVEFAQGATAGKYQIKPSSGRSLYGDKVRVDAADETNNSGNYEWILEEVTELPVTVTAAGYATFYAPVAVEVPAGVTAHTVTINGEWATLSEALTIVPANTGVVLAGEGSHNLEITTTENTATSALRGSAATTYYTEDGTYYALGLVDGEVGFYKDKFNNNRFQNNSHKAYLYVAEGNNAAQYSFRFGEGTTGIEQITDNREQSTVIYDLTGRRIEAITAPGVYIVNGKKVLVK